MSVANGEGNRVSNSPDALVSNDVLQDERNYLEATRMLDGDYLKSKIVKLASETGPPIVYHENNGRVVRVFPNFRGVDPSHLPSSVEVLLTIYNQVKYVSPDDTLQYTLRGPYTPRGPNLRDSEIVPETFGVFGRV